MLMNSQLTSFRAKLPFISWWLLLILLIGLPLSPFLVTIASHAGGSVVLLSGWKELLVGLILLVGLLHKRWFKRIGLVAWCAAGYLAYLLIDFLVRANYDQASFAGLLINARFIAIFLSAYLTGCYLSHRHLRQTAHIKLTITVLICLFALVVLIVPNRFLVNIGYDGAGVDRVGIPAASYYVSASLPLERLQSTMRGPNSLGLFLLLPISLILLGGETIKNRRLKIALITIFSGVLLLTYSRAAWLGLGLVFVVWAIKQGWPQLSKLKSSAKVSLGLAALVAVAIAGLSLATSPGRSLLLHQTDNQTNGSSSVRITEYQRSLSDIAKQPWGRGSGSASAAGRINQTTRSSENYYLQLARELGVVGVGLFLALNVVLVMTIWRQQSPYRLSLLVSFAALSLANFFLPVWAEEAVSLSWWLFAGLVIGFYSHAGSVAASSKRQHTSAAKSA